MLKVLISFVLLTAVAQQAHALYGVQDAVNDALTDDLKFVGSYVPSYSESGKMKMCVYKGTKTMVFSFYCTKQIVPAVSIRIHSLDPARGAVAFYAETDFKNDITKVKRDKYAEILLSVSATVDPAFNPNASIKDLQKFDEAFSKIPKVGCMSTNSFRRFCKPGFEGEIDSWGVPAEAWWNAPSNNWYDLVNVMKMKVP